ncbi:MAG: tyrosine-type recombinase/integrase [Solirubrobacterales bacterium]
MVIEYHYSRRLTSQKYVIECLKPKGGLDMAARIENWLTELHNDGKDEKTIIAYRTVLNQFSTWFEQTSGDSDLSKVTQMDIKDFKQYMAATLGRKPATINKALVTLKGFFEWAMENGFTPSNPARKVKLVEKQALAPKWLERSEQNRLIRAIEQEKNQFKKARDLAIVQVGLQAGLRLEEICNLGISDVTVNGRSGTVIVREGKRGKYREVPLNADIRVALKDYLKERETHKYGDSERLFIGERNPLLTPRAIQHLIEEYGRKAKIEGLTAHKLRHSFCHNLMDAKVGIEKVAMLAGHSSLESTRVYIVPGKRELQATVETIAVTDE